MSFHEPVGAAAPAPGRPGPDGGLRDQIVAYFEDHQKLVEAEAIRLLAASPWPLTLSQKVIEDAGPSQSFVTRAMVERILAVTGAVRTVEARSLSVTAPPREREAGPAAPRDPVPSFAVVQEGFSAPPTTNEPLEAYATLFASRYRVLSRMMRGRSGLPNLLPVGEATARPGTVSVIGMVRDVRTTPEKHHIIVRVEDETGSLECFVPKDTPTAKITFLPDEVVGLQLIVGSDRNRAPRVSSVERPESSRGRTEHRAASPSRVLFLSDLHIGSRSFLSGPWAELVEFLHGRGAAPELAAEIRYVVVAGDLVDGIGIYPNQERDLAIHDVFQQYEELGRRLRELPERLRLVLIPGNHDAVCPAEPQPSLTPEVVALLPPNATSLGNPSTVALDGVVVAAYHGRSFDDLIPAIPGASYSRPTDVMKRMLAMRHLAPMYGGRTPLAPLARDGLIIDPAPDILVTGHAHTFGVDQYNGTLLLNASTWQAETEYQRMRNITPVPARAAVVDLTSLAVSTLDFSTRRPEIEEAA
ncbi:MAG: metallophosphoesterase [Thermoplasmata archaeon]|nr:metallophosphoesterase [Thermoplasmata archaeon]